MCGVRRWVWIPKVLVASSPAFLCSRSELRSFPGHHDKYRLSIDIPRGRAGAVSLPIQRPSIYGALSHSLSQRCLTNENNICLVYQLYPAASILRRSQSACRKYQCLQYSRLAIVGGSVLGAPSTSHLTSPRWWFIRWIIPQRSEADFSVARSWEWRQCWKDLEQIVESALHNPRNNRSYVRFLGWSSLCP